MNLPRGDCHPSHALAASPASSCCAPHLMAAPDKSERLRSGGRRTIGAFRECLGHVLFLAREGATQLSYGPRFALSRGCVSWKSVTPQGPPISESRARDVPTLPAVPSIRHFRSSIASVAATCALWVCRCRSSCRRSTRNAGCRGNNASSWRTAISAARGGRRAKGSPGDDRWHEASTSARWRRRDRVVGSMSSNCVSAPTGTGTARDGEGSSGGGGVMDEGDSNERS